MSLFANRKRLFFSEELKEDDEISTYINTECEELDDSYQGQYTIRGQKEQQKAFNLNVEEKLEIENRSEMNHKTADVKEIIVFWESNGFGMTNLNGKSSCYLG